jgi:hypothetical protein
MKAAVGFLHAGEKSREATASALVRRGKESSAVHLVDPGLVDAAATVFPIDENRYAQIRMRAQELANQAERLVLTCSVYNGVAGWLAEDLGIRVDRSDAAGTREVLRTDGPIGVLVSYPPTKPVVVDYISEILAGTEEQREIRTSIAEDAPPFATADTDYRNALLAAVRPLRDCGVLFVAQFTMNPYLEELRAAWNGRPMISALDATLDALFSE